MIAKRKIVTVLLVLIGVNLSLGQERTLYIDLCENVVTVDSYDIKRVVRNHPEQKFQYIISDYHKNGQLFTTGLAKSKNGSIRDGEFTFYHPNGKTMAFGQLNKSQRVGEWKYWDSAGYQTDKDSLIGKIGLTRFKSDSILIEGKCFCYLKEFIWKWTNTITKKTTQEEYSDGNQVTIRGEYIVRDDTAIYKTGIKDFYSYLKKELTYPFITRLKGKYGNVKVEFTIDKNGNLINLKFLTSIDNPTEKRIKEVFEATSGSWTPAHYKGRPINSTLIMSIIFELI